MKIHLRDKYRGPLVGVHVGDAIGAPYETQGPKEIADDITARGSLTSFDYPNPWVGDGNSDILPGGRPTDDSDQTADLADSLIRCGELNVVDLRTSLRRSVITGKSLLWEGKATGSGGTTRKALSDDPEEVRFALANNIGTNGSLMRCVPMGLWFGQAKINSPKNNRWEHEQVRMMSEVTHTHPHSVQACWLYTKVLVSLLSEKEYFYRLDSSALEARIYSRLWDKNDFPYDPGAWPARGTAEFSLYVALYTLHNTKSFAEGIEMAVRVGGDTDTYAAIAGGLLGAKYGYEGIPKEWRDAILGHDVMVDLADKLFAMRMNK